MGRREIKNFIPFTGLPQKPGKRARDSRLLVASQHCLPWRPREALHHLILITPAPTKIIDWGGQIKL